MQLFITCFGQTKCLSIQSGSTIESLQQRVQELFEINSDIQLNNALGSLNESTIIDESFENSNLEASLEVLGGKGKKKRKQYTTPKKNKHTHKGKKLHTLSYYALNQDGTVQRVKKFCENETCKGKGIFMANHKNRYYCGSCHLTLIKKEEPKETATQQQKGGKKKAKQ